MIENLHFEIHFHTQYSATAQVKTEARGKQSVFLQVLLFCELATRQLLNLHSNPVSNSLALILAGIGTGGGSYGDYWQLMTKLKNETDIASCLPFIAALKVDISKLVALIPSLAIYRAVNKMGNEEIARQICPEVARVEAHQGIQGRKRFLADLEYRSAQSVNFQMEPKGFGFLGQGVNYYTPMSVVLAFNFLHSPHDNMKEDDIPSWRRLADAANRSGNAFLQGEITTLSQVTLPLEITNLVMSA